MKARNLMLAVAVFCFAGPAHAQPSADQVLTDMGLSAADKQRVLGGEFVTGDVAPVSEHDLSISIAFLVKTGPDALAAEISSGDLLRVDPQRKAHGEFKGDGTMADLAGLQIDAGAASRLCDAKAGEALNLSTAEIGFFHALQGGPPAAVQTQLQKMLLARYQAYHSTGLAGITPYDRGGRTTDPADDLKKASSAAAELEKYLPSLRNVLLGYPDATMPGMSETCRWIKYNIDGADTYVLSHTMLARDGQARLVVQRQFYVSTGYNGEQEIAGLLPVPNGTVVAYSNHTFTDQVAGWGGSARRSIGRRMMETKLQQIFDRERKQVAH